MNRNKTLSDIHKTYIHTYTQNRHITFSTATSTAINAYTMLLMLQFLVPAIHFTRSVSDARRISEKLFTKFSNLVVITLSETPAPYSCLFPLNCAKNFESHSIHRTEDIHTNRKEVSWSSLINHVSSLPRKWASKLSMANIYTSYYGLVRGLHMKK